MRRKKLARKSDDQVLRLRPLFHNHKTEDIEKHSPMALIMMELEPNKAVTDACTDTCHTDDNEGTSLST